eukprot:9494888-Pyramimonas_sp.AAC.1
MSSKPLKIKGLRKRGTQAPEADLSQKLAKSTRPYWTSLSARCLVVIILVLLGRLTAVYESNIATFLTSVLSTLTSSWGPGGPAEQPIVSRCDADICKSSLLVLESTNRSNSSHDVRKSPSSDIQTFPDSEIAFPEDETGGLESPETEPIGSVEEDRTTDTIPNPGQTAESSGMQRGDTFSHASQNKKAEEEEESNLESQVVANKGMYDGPVQDTTSIEVTGGSRDSTPLASGEDLEKHTETERLSDTKAEIILLESAASVEKGLRRVHPSTQPPTGTPSSSPSYKLEPSLPSREDHTPGGAAALSAGDGSHTVAANQTPSTPPRRARQVAPSQVAPSQVAPSQVAVGARASRPLSLIHISEPTRPEPI